MKVVSPCGWPGRWNLLARARSPGPASRKDAGVAGTPAISAQVADAAATVADLGRSLPYAVCERMHKVGSMTPRPLVFHRLGPGGLPLPEPPPDVTRTGRVPAPRSASRGQGTYQLPGARIAGIDVTADHEDGDPGGAGQLERGRRRLGTRSRDPGVLD